MFDIITSLKSFGEVTFEYLWFPLFVWTIIAIPIVLILRQSDSIPPIYQYHSRVAILLVLPLSIIGSLLTPLITQLFNSANATTTFIVIQNPIAVSTTAGKSTIGYSDPMLWIGLVSILLFIGTAFLIARMTIKALQLKQLDQNLDFKPLSEIKDLNVSNPGNRLFQKTAVAFSSDTNIPFTYGWLATKIVIPADLKDRPDKCAMAIHHELMHIKHRDFLLNGILMIVKAIFWFHPLTHHLYNTGKEYREIICDSEVLAENKFSKKNYAALLFELAERDYRNSQLAMSMAVNPSSLKKRIHIMSTQTNTTTKFRSSFLLSLCTAAFLVLAISCSDISDNGITNSEVQKTQSQMTTMSNDSKPLYIVNGEKWERTEETMDKLSRVKAKYIQNIEVLKGQKGEKEYGKAGENGVIKIQFSDGIDKETVFSDLKDVTPKPRTSSLTSDKEDFFITADDMPELKGGLVSLQKEINYPEVAQKAGIEGKVIVQFIVNEQGEVEDPQVIRGIGGGCDEEALRVVKQAEFKPGKNSSGEPVRVQYSLPITYRLSSGEQDQG